MLAGKVSGASGAAPAGLLRDKGEQVGLAIGKTLSTPEEIANLQLTPRDGGTVYVRNVADVAFVWGRDARLEPNHVPARGAW